MERILRELNTADPLPTRQAEAEAPTELPPHLAAAELVYIRKGGTLPPLAPPSEGPYKVIERVPKFFRLDIGSRMVPVSVDRLKPHTGAADATPAAPARQGRPPLPAGPPSSPPTPEFSTPTARSPSPGLPATTSACPARPRRAPVRLDL